MMKRLAVVFLLLAMPLAASERTLFSKYEIVRQALLRNAVADVKTSASDLANAARTAKQTELASRAEALKSATTLKDARTSFAALSDEMIRLRDMQTGERPQVVYCSMEKKSWLQPKGAIANPYVDAPMRACGEVRQQHNGS